MQPGILAANKDMGSSGAWPLKWLDQPGWRVAVVNYSVTEDPREGMNWRRHRQGCPHYRERWFAQSNPDAGEPMYQVFCLMNTPPETAVEQERCLSSRTCCWRVAEAARRASKNPAATASDGKRGRQAS
jgi:hypothetical protein